jgi:hypothetical protein
MNAPFVKFLDGLSKVKTVSPSAAVDRLERRLRRRRLWGGTVINKPAIGLATVYVGHHWGQQAIVVDGREYRRA